MKIWVHVLSSLILITTLYPIFKWKTLIIFVGGVLIDIDHYFWCLYKFKKCKLVDCYKYFADLNNIEEHVGMLQFFHTIEFMLISVLLGLYNEFVFMFTIGLLTHYLLDLIWYYYAAKRLIVNHSILSWIIKNKIQKLKSA